MTFKILLNQYRAWNNQRKLKKARKLILETSPQKIGAIGRNRVGTVMKLKDIHFSVRKNRLEYKYIKLRRCVTINRS